MKSKYLFMSLLAASCVFFTSCGGSNKDEESPALTVTPTALTFEKTASSQTISVTANRTWTATTTSDWISVSPASGKASDDAVSLTVSVLENTGSDREGTVSVVLGSGLVTTTVAVKQAGATGPVPQGDGSLEKPYSPAQASAVASALAADATTEKEVYVKGKIVKIADNGEFAAQFGNATFYISEDGTETGTQFYVYRVLYLENKKWVEGNTQIKVGDEVIIYSKLVNFKGNTPENKGGYIYSLNGNTKNETPDVPVGEIKDVTVAEFNAAAESTTQFYRLKGVIASISSTTYGNLTLKDDSGEVYVYGVKASKDASNTSFSELGAAVGDTLIVVGNRGSHNDKIEMMNGYCEKLLKGKGGSDEPDDPAEAEKYASNISWTNGENAYDDGLATVGTVKNVKIYKIGTAKKAGTATIKIPKGTKKVSFYGVAWKGKATTIVIKYAGADVYTQDLAANNGATGNSPYTITIAESDHYVFDLTTVLGASGAPMDLEATLTTKAGASTRAMFFGMKAE